MTGVLTARGVSFVYPSDPGREVIARVSIAVAPGDRLGVVGENGSGKSTLLAVLAGRLTPTRGEVTRRGEIAVVEQELEVPDGEASLGDLVTSSLGRARRAAAELEQRLSRATGAEVGESRALADAVAQYEATAAWDADRLLDEALTRLGAPRDHERRLGEMSVGERYRVRLACRLAEASDLLLLDEPTNHLDAVALDHLTNRLRSWPGGVVVVTHDRRLLDDVATAILDLDPTIDGAPARYGASSGHGDAAAGRAFDYALYRRAKDAALARWRSRYRREQERLAQLFDERDRAYEHLSDEWRPPKGSRRHRRGTRARQHVKNADRQHERLTRDAVEVPPPPPELALPLLPAHPRAHDGAVPLLALRDAVVPGRLQRPDLAVELAPGGRLLVVGSNGTGKSTLLTLLAASGTSVSDVSGVSGVSGASSASGASGSSGAVRIGVLAQEPAFGARESATGEQIATERILAALEAGGLDPEEVVPLASTGLIAPELLDRPVRELSTGQRRRLDLALTLMAAPHVLVLDEPTNHLAVDLMDALTQWLAATPAAVVVATHDRRMRADLGPGGASWPVLDLG